MCLFLFYDNEKNYIFMYCTITHGSSIKNSTNSSIFKCRLERRLKKKKQCSLLLKHNLVQSLQAHLEMYIKDYRLD